MLPVARSPRRDERDTGSLENFHRCNSGLLDGQASGGEHTEPGSAFRRAVQAFIHHYTYDGRRGPMKHE